MNGPMKSTYHRFNSPISDNKSIIITKTTPASHPQPHTIIGAYHKHKSIQPLENFIQTSCCISYIFFYVTYYAYDFMFQHCSAWKYFFLPLKASFFTIIKQHVQGFCTKKWVVKERPQALVEFKNGLANFQNFP